jgi:type VI secretion system secreted protein VgrG
MGNRFGTVTTPLGKDVLLFSRMKGYEEISRLFEYEIDLFSEQDQVDIKKILGLGMAVSIDLPAGGIRYFHGLVCQFRHHGAGVFKHQGISREYYHYRAIVRPWLWILTRRSNCRIFQTLSVPDILKKVFQAAGFSDYKLSLTKTYQKRDYCVQYRETDFNFVSRLMECEGIFYFFTHEQSKHTLVIADSVSAYQKISNYQTLSYFPPGTQSQREQAHIYEWHNYHEIQSGTYVLNDFDFEKPKGDLLSKFIEKKQYAHSDGEQYDYPGNYLETGIGETYATARLNELLTRHAVVHGQTNAVGLTNGMSFTLKDHYISSENSKHLVIYTDFSIDSSEDLVFECQFMAIRETQTFIPSRLTPIPFVQGPQTAIVVGKSGEEIWTDKYGRVKVQFHWDREGKNNELSSCWVRVSHPMAGKNWGWISLPRIGQEVIVSFLEGNPDRPMITGRVYNADQMPPYTLPANQTQSGMKTRSSKQGTAENFNEIRFEDKKDAEEVYVHAEKDFNCVIENNETRKIGLIKKDKGNQTVEIHNDRTVTLNEGNDTLTVKKGYRLTNIDTGDETLNVKKGNRLTNIDTGNETLNVKKGNRETNINTGNETLNVKTGNRVTNVNTGNDTTNVKMGNYTVKVSLGKITMEAMQSIELKVGANSVKIEQSGITIKGIMVKVEGSAMLEAKSPMTTVKGDGMLILQGGLTKIN